MNTTTLNKQEPYLAFEFASSSGKIKPFTFRKPIKVIIAHKIEEVIPCFHLVQQHIDNGYYAAGFLSYESAPAFDSAFKARNDYTMPLLWFGIFSEPETLTLASTGTYTLSEWNSSVKEEEYQSSIMSIKESNRKWYYISNQLYYPSFISIPG